MSEHTGQTDMAQRKVVLTISGMESVVIRRDVEYEQSADGSRLLDLYAPPGFDPGSRCGAVVLVNGYPDASFRRLFGCRQKEIGAYVSWAKLFAASGVAAITYTSPEPARDLGAVLRAIRQNAESLGIDPDRIAIWACSGNVPTALGVLMQQEDPSLKCAILCYGLMLDLGGSTSVADGARQWGFANPAASKSIADLPAELPLFIARAGRDEIPGLNESVDEFIAGALARNLPLTFVNHPSAPHAFDLYHDSETTREIIRRILEFVRLHLRSVAGSTISPA